MHAGRAPKGLWPRLREADVTRLSRSHELGHGAHAVLDRHLRVHAMELVEVDVVDSEPAQAVLAGVQDVGRAAVDPADGVVRRVAHDAALGREHHAVAPAANGASHELLVGERAVHVRGVEQRHAEVEGAVDGGDRLRLVARTVELAHAHAAEADGGDLERAQSSRLHAAGVRPGTSSRNPRRS